MTGFRIGRNLCGMVNINLGRKVRIYRASKHITQKDLSEQLGLSQTALSLLENNRPVPQIGPEKLAEIAKLVERAA